VAETVKVVFEADNSRVVAAAQQVDKAFDKLGKSAGATTSAVAKSTDKLAAASEAAAKSAGGITAKFGESIGRVKAVGDQVQGVVGKLNGYLGAAGLIIGALGAIVALTADWVQETSKAEEAAKKSAAEHEAWAARIEERDARAAYNRDQAALASEFRNKRLEEEAKQLEHNAALIELEGANQEEVNDLLIEALRIRQKMGGANASDIERQIELIKAREDALYETVTGSVDRAASRPREVEIVVNLDPVFPDITEELVAREDEINQRRLANIAAQQAAEREVANARLAAEIEVLQASEGNAGDIHRLRMRQIEAEARARDEALASQQQALAETATGDGLDALKRQDEIRQLTHDREMERMRADLEMRVAVAEESKRIAAEQQAALESQLATINDVASSIESVSSDFTSKLSGFVSDRMAGQQAELDAYTANLERRGEAQAQSLDREIARAKGNADRVAALQRAKLKIEQDTANAIEKAKASHAAKADKIERVQKGTSMLLEGALATVRAAASYPNIPQMVALAAAAALAFGFGIATLAGGTPGAGGAGGGASLAGAGSGGGGGAMEFGEAARTPGSTGTSSGNLPRLSKSSEGAGGGVVYNGPVTYNASGSIDRDAADAWALEVGKSTRSREGAGRT
jgi:hypothetical protein